MYYNAFGKPTIYNGALAVQRNVSNYAWTKTFTGQVYDPEFGLMLYRNRYYHPTLGRFITRAPIGYEGRDENLYRYVENNVLCLRDLFGKDWLDCMSACIKDNDPIDKVLTKIPGLLTAQPIPKSIVATLADAVGDHRLARQIRRTMNLPGVNRLTTMPSALSAKLRAGGRSSLRLLERLLLL